MISIRDMSIEDINIDEAWNFSNDSEYIMHSLHAYPAKFPAFLASKAFEYAQQEGVNVQKVADVFCGCGTVALEAKLHGKDFWGCDINPVATLIASAKSASYSIENLNMYYEKIQKCIEKEEGIENLFETANERIKYWFTKESYMELFKIKNAIDKCVEDEKYKTAFLCIFSSILKASSKWLTKSIKPQIDPDKKEINIPKTFDHQYQKFIRAVKEINQNTSKSNIDIVNENFLTVTEPPKVDLLITSPPYVTSYEYADLHQLSSLWLGFADDYRELRQGSIGSVYNSNGLIIDSNSLNEAGRAIISQLKEKEVSKSKIKSIARYYLDMQQAVEKCFRMINKSGMVFFVIGDTEYKGVKIMNSKHLIQAMGDSGFVDIKVAKRRISNKLLTPYRDCSGRFSSDKMQRTIYHEELIISGRVREDYAERIKD